jgi:hypothetical protein
MYLRCTRTVHNRVLKYLLRAQTFCETLFLVGSFLLGHSNLPECYFQAASQAHSIDGTYYFLILGLWIIDIGT